MAKLIIGIDFSKETMNFCCLDGKTGEILKESVVPNTDEGCKEMVKELRGLRSSVVAGDFLFCGENTGIYSLVAADYLTAKHYPVWLETPLEIKLSSGIRREKTDSADARMIAEYAFRFRDRARIYRPSSQTILKLKSWLKVHNELTKNKVSIRGVLKNSVLDKAAIKPLEVALLTIEEQLKNVNRQIKQTLQDEELKVNADLMRTVPGISDISAAAIIIDTQNFTRFNKARQYAAHTGCIPYKHESGTSIHRKEHVCKASNRYINTLLTQGSVSIMTHNPQMRAYAEKKRSEGKHNGCIINNIRNKTLHRVFAVIRTQRPFDANYRCTISATPAVN